MLPNVWIFLNEGFIKNQFQFIRFIFVDDRDLKSSIERGGWSFTYCFWNAPILYIWQLLQKKQHAWFINHSFFSWVAPTRQGSGDWRGVQIMIYTAPSIAENQEIAKTTSRKGIWRENKQSKRFCHPLIRDTIFPSDTKIIISFISMLTHLATCIDLIGGAVVVRVD